MDFKDLSEHIIRGRAPDAEQWTQAALSQGIDEHDILERGLIPGMEVVGEKFKHEECFLPEVLLAARAMKTVMALLRPRLAQTPSDTLRGRVVIGTVQGDLHDIGKNLVAMLLEGAGFDVTDLGNDVSPETFVTAAADRQADMVCMSALLTTTMSVMGKTIAALQDAGLRPRVKVMVGGAPVNDTYASNVGADGYAPDAATAVDRAKNLLGVKSA
jgi:5-methyltetrahydrofolate--homocysteine methyltransferase